MIEFLQKKNFFVDAEQKMSTFFKSCFWFFNLKCKEQQFSFKIVLDYVGEMGTGPNTNFVYPDTWGLLDEMMDGGGGGVAALRSVRG